jgi:high-affinity K+ transport system ATPase subunit B
MTSIFAHRSVLQVLFGIRAKSSADTTQAPIPVQRTAPEEHPLPANVAAVKPHRAEKVITVNVGDVIPCDGLVIEGFAFVDESAVAGVSTAAMIDASAGRNQVIEGGVVVEGFLKIKCTGNN